jgi:hypothetical protein
MAEAVGYTASIIAIVQLAGKIASLGYGYIDGVSQARKDITDLFDELESLVVPSTTNLLLRIRSKRTQ